MLGEEEAVEDERAFNNASVWKRLAIVFAGPIMNIGFGLILFWILASIYNKNAYIGLLVTKNYIVLLFQAIAGLFTGGFGGAGMVGPVGISTMIVQTNGLFDFAYLIAVISISLGVTNLLPIPGLDGGKILLLVVEIIRGKKVSEKTELTLTAMRNATIINVCSVCYSKGRRKINVKYGGK